MEIPFTILQSITVDDDRHPSSRLCVRIYFDFSSHESFKYTPIGNSKTPKPSIHYYYAH